MAKKPTQNATHNSYDTLNDQEFLFKLIVGIGEVAEITGVPQRQLRYWQKKGLIESVYGLATSTRCFNYLEIKKILLIKELLDEGFTLEAAASKIEKRIKLIDAVFSKIKDRHNKKKS